MLSLPLCKPEKEKETDRDGKKPISKQSLMLCLGLWMQTQMGMPMQTQMRMQMQMNQKLQASQLSPIETALKLENYFIQRLQQMQKVQTCFMNKSSCWKGQSRNGHMERCDRRARRQKHMLRTWQKNDNRKECDVVSCAPRTWMGGRDKD